jgi:signal transduction histidine kinase
MSSRRLTFAGILTWSLVAAVHLPGIWMQPGRSPFERLAVTALLCAFLLAFLVATRESCTTHTRIGMLVLQSILALSCIALVPDGFMPILLVVVSGQLGRFPFAGAVAAIAVQSLVLASFDRHFGRHKAVVETLAYFTFQLFGVFTARIVYDEREARQALAAANAELRVATGLLDISSRAEERLRIARELHDLLGHHLTALSLNLEVASHLAGGEALQHIVKSQSLTKLLLSDVRDSVSRLREDEPVDLAAALRSIRDAVAAPVIHVDAESLGVTEPEVARTALRAVQEIVTNTLRHAGARNLWLTVGVRDRTLSIDARDDGAGTDRLQLGNGLRGMGERVRGARGTLDIVSAGGRGFEVHIRLPLEETP